MNVPYMFGFGEAMVYTIGVAIGFGFALITFAALRERLEDLEAQLADLEREYADLEEIWKSEKAAMQGTAHIKEELERARLELETAHRANDLARMSELQYGRIPELEKQLAEATTAEQRETTLLRNNVTEEEVAEIVSKWTGIPVAKRARSCART